MFILRINHNSKNFICELLLRIKAIVRTMDCICVFWNRISATSLSWWTSDK